MNISFFANFDNSEILSFKDNTGPSDANANGVSSVDRIAEICLSVDTSTMRKINLSVNEETTLHVM
jgi:hypothetical protein